MPWYNDLRPKDDPNKKKYALTFAEFEDAGKFEDSDKLRTLENLLKLRRQLREQLEIKKTDKNLLLASWNIKEFGHLQNRIPESHFYIAEIISSFDLIAIQEVKTGLRDFDILMKLLGDNWDYLINDVTEGRSGNSERFAYVYDKRRVKFTGLAGEIGLWEELFAPGEQVIQLERPPYLTGFQSGWKSFALLNVHLQPGEGGDNKKVRKREVRFLMKALAEKKKRKTLWTENIVILGDFNLYKSDVDIVEIFEAEDFFESDLLERLVTNIAVTSQERFDRMFFKRNEYFATPSKENGNKGGMIDIFKEVYRDPENDFKNYKKEMKEHKEKPQTLTDDAAFKKYFRDTWRKIQISDHCPIWIEIDIDSSDKFLEDKKKEFEN
ncbi:MAG: endonuclease/exonuclease/phosphatase family protein [Pyrinomonadaceae bacterium]